MVSIPYPIKNVVKFISVFIKRKYVPIYTSSLIFEQILRANKGSILVKILQARWLVNRYRIAKEIKQL